MRNFEESFAHSDFGYYWSLSLENQFYLLLPIMLLMVPRRWRVRGLVGLCVLNAVWRPGGETWWLFRYDGLIYGLLLFELERAGYSDILAQCLPASLRGRIAVMAAALVALVGRGRPLGGVFHLAMYLDDRLLATQAWPPP